VTVRSNAEESESQLGQGTRLRRYGVCSRAVSDVCTLMMHSQGPRGETCRPQVYSRERYFFDAISRVKARIDVSEENQLGPMTVID
jgi:hypothetical protein